MNELILDWDADGSAIDLLPLRGYKLYESHRWEEFDLPVWTNLVSGGSDADPVGCSDVCSVLEKHLPRFDRVIERDWQGRFESVMDSVWAFGFSRNFAAIVHPAKSGDGGQSDELSVVGVYLRDEEEQRRGLWTEIARDLSHLPILVYFQHFVQAQCLINDYSSLDRVWDGMLETRRLIREKRGDT